MKLETEEEKRSSELAWTGVVSVYTGRSRFTVVADEHDNRPPLKL